MQITANCIFEQDSFSISEISTKYFAMFEQGLWPFAKTGSTNNQAKFHTFLLMSVLFYNHVHGKV